MVCGVASRLWSLKIDNNCVIGKSMCLSVTFDASHMLDARSTAPSWIPTRGRLKP